MQSIVLNALKVINAVNFRNNLLTGSVYMYIGRTAAWDAEMTPPLSNGSVASKIETRDAIKYISKIQFDDTCLAIARNNWTLNQIYSEYSETGVVTGNGKNYVITAGNNVYKCISNNGAVASTVTPSGTSVNIITLSDGYQWKFMFNLSPTIATKFLTPNYIPLPTGTQRTAFQVAVEEQATYTTGSPPGGHGSNPKIELGASNTIISKSMVFEEIIVSDFSFRQFGMWSNPILLNTTPATADYYVINNNVNLQSGELLTITNHTAVSTEGLNSETIQLITSF